MTGTRARVIQWVFYGGLGIALLLIVTRALDILLPSLASRIAYNSEGYFFALFLGLWIQVMMPRIPSGRRMPWALGYGAFWALVGVGLALSELPSRIKTLNEAALALAIVIPYVTLRRPLARWVLGAVPALIALTIWAVGWAPQSWIIDQAETFGFVILAMLTFDVFDRVLLDRDAEVNRPARWAWYGFMVLEPIVISLIGTDARHGVGPAALTLEYLGRIHESFFGMLLVAIILHLVRGYRQRL